MSLLRVALPGRWYRATHHALTMPGSPPTGADDDRPDPDSWPWACLDCGTTIYHDGECCRDCARARQLARAASEGGDPGGFLEWMAGEPAPAFVLKVSTVAAMELALTSVWLQFVLP